MSLGTPPIYWVLINLLCPPLPNFLRPSVIPTLCSPNPLPSKFTPHIFLLPPPILYPSPQIFFWAPPL